MKSCTRLWREAHFQVKMYKVHSRTTFGSWGVEKSARRCGTKHISKSKCTKHLTFGSWCCGAKHMSKSKCTKHTRFRALFEVETSKKCTPLWREAHFQVKSVKNWRSRTTFGSWDVEKGDAVVARSTFPSQNARNTQGSEHFLKLRCRKSARCCGAKHISKSKCLINTTCSDRFWTFRCRFTWQARGIVHLVKIRKMWGLCRSFNYSHHYTPLHYYNYNYTTLNYTTLITFLYATLIALHYYITPHYTALHYTTPHYTTLHHATLHYTTLHYTTLHYTNYYNYNYNYFTLHYTTQHHNYNYNSTTLQLQLHYTTLHPAVVGEVTDQVTTATVATTPKNTTPTTFQSISGFALPSVIHNNQALL